MYAPSIGNQAYTIAVWMFADWISRNPHMVAEAPEQSPPTWTPEQWQEAATLEEAFRLFGGRADGSDDLRDTKNETPAAIRQYVGENESELCRADDGILRRFPDQLIQILLMGRGDVQLDAAGAMADALEIVRNIRRAS
jgi:hypothetical protein